MITLKHSFYFLAVFALQQVAIAQSVISPPDTGVTALAPTAGSGRSTENLSVTNGSRTTLSVGNATTFGATANLTASAGLTSLSRTVLVPDFVKVESAIGSGLTAGKTTINISNLTAKGGGTINPGSDSGAAGSIINATDSQYASGNALIDGMDAQVYMTIDTTKGGIADFFATVHPNISPESDACAPGINNACLYVTNDLVSGNSGSSANLSTQTNIDIQANSFTNTFAQSF